MQNLPLDTATFRRRAKQCRQLAGGCGNDGIRERLLAIAQDYDALATRTKTPPDKAKPIDLAERLVRRGRAS